MRPTVGRVVLYTSPGGDHDGLYTPEGLAAIITGVNPMLPPDPRFRTQLQPSVSLMVFDRTGMFARPAVDFTDAPPGSEAARGKWTWPPRA